MIQVNHLTKYFDSVRAVDHISFDVHKGEILGFLGPNGAGKSTTMRMITGFIPPSAGTAVIGGSDIVRDAQAARTKMGYLPENAPVYPDMTVFDYLAFCAEVRGFRGAARKRNVAETIEKCFLRGVEFQTISTLSKGYKQRVCFAQSILHDPEYLILDEPTDGLDPNQKHEVRLMIREMSAAKAIVLSTHILDEVDAVCSRAIIIAEGRIVVDDTPEGLRARSPHHGMLRLTLSGADGKDLSACMENLAGVKAVETVSLADGRLEATVLPQIPEAATAQEIMGRLLQNGFRVESLQVERGRLDDVFRMVTHPAPLNGPRH